MSDTPRTDAKLWYFAEDDSYQVPAEFARTLERELAAAREELARMKKHLLDLTDTYRKAMTGHEIPLEKSRALFGKSEEMLRAAKEES